MSVPPEGADRLKDYWGAGVTECSLRLLTRPGGGSKLKRFLVWQETPRHSLYRTLRRSGAYHIHSQISPGLAFPLLSSPAVTLAGPACLESRPWISLS